MPVIAEVATGLISSALFEAARRPVNWVVSANRRQREISRAVDGKKSGMAEKHDANVTKAFNDLVRVLGNHYGEYTTDVDLFLKELKSSAIPGTLYRTAIVGRSSEPIFPAFELLYRSFEPLSISSTRRRFAMRS